METKTNKYFLYLGVTWTILFACMSFYWAMGGMLGVRSLGGEIYEIALNPEPSFILIVWITGFMKLLGIVILMLLLANWRNSRIRKILYFITKTLGLLLFIYGLLNIITISLSILGILDFKIDHYAAPWRLFFWEPYWMLGGIFYFFSVKKVSSPVVESHPFSN